MKKRILEWFFGRFKREKNRDIRQIRLFSNCFMRHSIDTYEWKEGKMGDPPEIAYLKLTNQGIKDGKVKNLSKLEKLLNAKKNRDLHKKLWTEGLREGLLWVEDFEKKHKGIIFDCMKDIIKTTPSRINYMPKPRICSMTYCANRNWFIDKLKLKMPENACNCYVCKEEFWLHKRYVKKALGLL